MQLPGDKTPRALVSPHHHWAKQSCRWAALALPQPLQGSPWHHQDLTSFLWGSFSIPTSQKLAMRHSLENSDTISSWKVKFVLLCWKCFPSYGKEAEGSLGAVIIPPLSAGQGVPRAPGSTAQTLRAQLLPATQDTGPGSERGRSCGTKVHGTTQCQQSQYKSWFGKAKSSSVPLVPTGCNGRDRLHVRGC